MARVKPHLLLLLLPVLFIGMGVAGCAKEGMPPGGPVDETAPGLVEIFPEPGSIDVSRGQPIVFRFSEAMNRRSVERALFFTPDIGPTLIPRWRKRELRLDPWQPYRENTTIVVTVGADATDLQNNRMGQSVTLAFSTGSVLDNASVSGSVLEDGRFLPGAWIWIYPVPAVSDQEDVSDPSPLLPLQPLYITQADDTGRFRQSHIARGTYRIFAFHDNNGNRRFDRDTDPLAVPPVSIRFAEAGDWVEGFILSTSPRDTTGPMIRSASAPNRNFVQVRFSEPPASGSRPAVTLEAYTEEGAEVPSGDIELLNSYTPSDAPAALILHVDGLLPEQRYRVRLLSAEDARGNPGIPASRPVTFSVPAREDTTRPAVVGISPSDSSRTLNEDVTIKLNFSTEIDNSRQPYWILAGPDTVELKSEWPDPRTLLLRPRSPLTADAFYNLVIGQESLHSWTDISGPPEEWSVSLQAIRPSGKGTIRFTVEGDELPEGGHFLIFLEGAGSSSTPSTEIELTAAGEVLTPELLVGPYMVWGFADTDGNGVFDAGKAAPYMPAETVGAIPDTLYVTDSFESIYRTPLILKVPVVNPKITGPPR